VWIVALGFVLLLCAAAVRRSRRERLARVRAEWGQPVDRPRRFDAMARSHESRIAATKESTIDDRTWIDLNLDEVFAALDRTHSTLGQHALYHRLRTAPVGHHLAAFEALVTRMSHDAAARERAQLALARLQDPHGYDVWWLTDAGAAARSSWYWLFPMLTLTSAGLAAAALVWSFALAPLVVVLACNVAVRYFTDRRIGGLARMFRQLAPLIAAAESLQFLTGKDIDPIVGALRNATPALSRLKSISRWVNGDPLMLSVNPNPIAAVVNDVVNVLYEYLNLAFLLDATGVYFGTRDLARHGAALMDAVAAAGEVDAALSVASYRAGRQDWVRPEFRLPGDGAQFADLRHPLIDDAVPNSIALPPGRGVLVTGSNMSGKSTFLRTVGVNAILAQTIDTCLAREYRAPVLSVRTCIGRADDLLTGRSYFIVEVEALLALVGASGQPAPHLFLLDELFRGTNAVERIAAGQAVLQELLDVEGASRPHFVLAATHDGELVELAAERFDAYHFGDSIGPDGLIFDHRLHAGPATTRNAIALLRIHGAPEALLRRAMTTAARLDRERRPTVTSHHQS
jgi:hypothetical protein